ncbi:hypothetical protein Acr_12g0001050 [Actinidia rufa]|uniref:Uncharacterized protein n=1 Tax=Actinidia rufa TaxID=165716 RepID=A0A7J0FFU0_9ERIC|nr:hypothetical protein Acr_12g0001050 [Actinidia rufa]
MHSRSKLVPNAWRSVTYALSLWQAYKYAMSLFEFRNLFSLNNNPKPDHNWLYFKARYKKILFRGYPAKCNNPPRLYGDEITRVEHVFSSVEEKGLYSISALLQYKSFRRVFGPRQSMVSDEENKDEDRPAGDAPTSSGDASESSNSRDELSRGGHSRDSSVECIGIIRCLGTRSLELKLAFLEFEFKLGSYKNHGSPPSSNRMIESLPFLSQEADHETHPSKGGGDRREASERRICQLTHQKIQVTDNSKGKEVAPQSEPKKKMAAMKSRNVASLKATHMRKPGEGPSVSPDARLALVFGSSLVVWGWERLDKSALQQGQTASLEDEAADELAKVKGEQDALSDILDKSAVLVGKLRDMVGPQSKELTVKEFKYSSEYDVAIKNAVSKYFGKGFDFYKRQLRRHHPDLDGDPEGMGFDHDILAEEDENEDEKSGGEKEKEDGEKGDDNPPPS